MATHPQRVEPEFEPLPWRLTDELDQTLAGLKLKGLEVLWIEACQADLATLVVEDDETTLRLDPDPAVDCAWYGDIEIRATAVRSLTWVFVRGEDASGEPSAYIVSLPEPPTPAEPA